MRIQHITSVIRLLLILIFNSFLFTTISAQNYVTTYAGTGSTGFVNGDTSIAQFNRPFGICIDQEGNLYLADAYNHCIRKIGIDGIVSTYAGTGQAGYLDGGAAEAKFNQPINICLDDEGNMYVSDFINQRIRKISSEMEVTTIAGTGIAGYQEGLAMDAQFNYPRGICLDDTGNIYIGDSWNHRIRKISIEGVVSTWAGGGSIIGVQSVGDYIDASDTAARFYTPCELSIDQYNNIFVADAYNHRIRKIDTEREVSTIAGSGGFGPDGGGFENGPGDQARFDTPTALQVILDGSVFVGDGANNVLRKISTDNLVTTFAGSGESGFENGPDTLAQFNFPRGNVMDYNLNRIYIVDYNNHAIRILHLVPITDLPDGSFMEKKIELFPNPTMGDLHIRLAKNHETIEINLYNDLGNSILKRSYHNCSTIQFELEDQKPGLYFLSIYTDNELLAYKKVLYLKP